jgi:hypothetical protein
MDGIQLQKPEFAYLLAAVGAQEILGVDDPALFPSSDAEREASFSAGSEQLREAGWLKPVPDHDQEFELNVLLLEMVALIGAPDQMIAVRTDPQNSVPRQVLFFLSTESIVELSIVEDGSYRLGFVDQSESYPDRIAKFFDLKPAKQSGQLSIKGEVIDQLRSTAVKGETKKASELLKTLEGDSSLGKSFLSALADPNRGEFVVMHLTAGEISTGRRAYVHGEGKNAWVVHRIDTKTDHLLADTLDAASLTLLLNDWLSDFSN